MKLVGPTIGPDNETWWFEDEPLDSRMTNRALIWLNHAGSSKMGGKSIGVYPLVNVYINIYIYMI